jgi:hypothetical protein
MFQRTVVGGTAAFLLGSTAAGACTLTPFDPSDPFTPRLVCAAPGTYAPQSSALDDLLVIVQDGASVTKPATGGNGSALTLSGDGVTVQNEGAIIGLRTNNNNDNNGIQGTGTDLTVENYGQIESGDRGIHITGGGGGFTLLNFEDATIESRRQAVRTLNELALPGSTVYNWGTIESTDDRAIQLRGPGAQVYNYGALRGGGEVVEAREDFTLENYGTIVADPASTDADGVQFASGRADNYGLIQGTDDGIDIDEGTVVNHAGGQIIGGTNGSGIDIDALFEPSVGPSRPAGDLFIVNHGTIGGQQAIGADEAATNRISITNTGILFSQSPNAILFGAMQGDSTVTLDRGGEIYGNVVFGGGDDLFRAGGLLTDAALIDGFVDGGEGTDTVDLLGYALSSIAFATIRGDFVDLGLNVDGGLFEASFINFEFWTVGNGQTYSTRDFVAAVAAIPLPAGAGLMLTALGGLAMLGAARRRG